MKNWLNKIIGRTPAPTRNKVTVDLRYQSHRFTMDDFKNAGKEIESAAINAVDSTISESNEPDSATSNNSCKVKLIK